VCPYAVNGTYTIVLTVTDGLLREQTETKTDYLMAYKEGDANVNRIIDMADVTCVERKILVLD
jgi:PKD repeat protein